MAKSELLTKVAILRAAIGISMKEFAELTGRTFYTWKALEAGRLKLSEDLAGRIAEATGVSLAWLLDDSIKGPPFDRNGERVTPQRFEDHRAMVTAGWKIVSRELKEEHAAIQGRRLDSILKNIEGYHKFNLALFRVVKFLAKLEEDCAPAAPAPKSAESKRKRRGQP
jgi:transcriptional regulator with XRE-family HTH domain